jgi:chitin synthase
MPPVQIIFCFKQRNDRKINSLRWSYHGFCRLLNPKVCVTIDAGVILRRNALLHLWEAFQDDESLGGVCGALKPTFGGLNSSDHNFWYKSYRHLFRPLLGAQDFEYKVSSHLGKPLESAFGYLTVLPGAFSAYRFRAILGQSLNRFFQGDRTLSDKLGAGGLLNMSVFHRNLFLAEDRILCFEVVFKANCKWHLKYIGAAKAEVDIPETFIDFVSQRRRWLNGSFAATVYSILRIKQIYGTSHNPIRLALFHVQVLYNVLCLVLSWFSLASFLLSTFIISDISSKPPSTSNARPFPFGKATPVFDALVQLIYLATIALQFIMALGDHHTNQVAAYVASFIIFGVIQLYFGLNVLYLLVHIFKAATDHSGGGDYAYISTFYSDIGSLTVIVACISVFGIYYAAALLRGDPWYMFFSYPQYLFVASSYTNILTIFAFSKWDDVSWGNKSSKDPTAIYNSTAAFFAERGHERDVPERLPLSTIRPGPSRLSTNPTNAIDIEFERTVRRALEPPVQSKVKDWRSPEQKLFASFTTFRTKLIAVYIFTNFSLCIFVMNDSFESLHFLVGRNLDVHKIRSLTFACREMAMCTSCGSFVSGCGQLQLHSSCGSWGLAGISSCRRTGG